MQLWNTRLIRVAVLAAACVLVALPATALGQDTSLDDRINQLQARVDALEASIAALEGPPAPVAAPAPAPPAPPQLLVDASGSDDAQTNRFSVDAGSLQMCWDVSLESSKPTYITFTVHSVNPSGNVAESLVTTAESKCTQVRVDGGTYYVGVNQVEPGSWHLTVKPS